MKVWPSGACRCDSSAIFFEFLIVFGTQTLGVQRPLIQWSGLEKTMRFSKDFFHQQFQGTTSFHGAKFCYGVITSITGLINNPYKWS